MFFGIDLGMTHACIAYVDESGRAVVVPNAANERTTPSVIFFPGGDQVVVGRVAKEVSELYPDRVATFFRLWMGSEMDCLQVDGISYQPAELSSLVLRMLVADAEKWTQMTITDVVIACPAWFDARQLDAMKRAGEIAGLNVRAIINEPTAAAISYGVETADDESVLIYDLGGGTFDVTIVEMKNNVVVVVCNGGDHMLGGRNWDDAIVRFLLEEARKEIGQTDELNPDRELLQDLYLRAERAKQLLGRVESTKIPVIYEGEKCRIELTRDKFQDLTRDLLENTINLTRQLLADAAAKGKNHVSKILLVGGSTKMPQVRQRLEQEFCVPCEGYEQDEAIARGAAIFGSKLMYDDEITTAIAEETETLLPEIPTNTNPEMCKAIASAKPESPTRLFSKRMMSNVHSETAHPPVTDRVELTVTAPLMMVPSHSYVLDAWVHLKHQRNEVLKRAQQAQGGENVRVRSQTGIVLARETLLAVCLDMPGFVVNNAESVINWEGSIGTAGFPVCVPEHARTGSHTGSLTFRAAGLKVAVLHFTVEVGHRELPSDQLHTREHRCRTAFASYASDDREHVLARIQGIQKALPDLDIFLDVRSLRSGERWSDRLVSEVISRDVFYLFWSKAASQSQWVDREWRIALARRGVDYIDPVPLVSPTEVPPPPELAEHLHFNDWVLAFMRGKELPLVDNFRGGDVVTGDATTAGEQSHTSELPTPMVSMKPSDTVESHGRAIGTISNNVGFLYVLQVAPDLSRKRLKLGFAFDHDTSLAEHRTTSPTAACVRTWPCLQTWTAAAIDFLTNEDCRLIGTGVYDCEKPEGLLDRGNAFFAMMPKLTRSTS